MLTIEIKMLDDDRERKKEYMKNYYYKKNLINHLIYYVEELENVSLDEHIFSYFQSIKKQKVST